MVLRALGMHAAGPNQPFHGTASGRAGTPTLGIQLSLRRLAALGLYAACSAGNAAEADVVGILGLGPATFGMSLQQFNRATGAQAHAPTDVDEQSCFYAEAARWSGVSFMFVNRRLRRIDVRAEQPVTARGIGVGSSISQVKAAYGSSVVDEPHFYSGPQDRYLTVHLSRSIAVRFETSDNRVDNFYVGGKKPVQYVEGCL